MMPNARSLDTTEAQQFGDVPQQPGPWQTLLRLLGTAILAGLAIAALVSGALIWMIR